MTAAKDLQKVHSDGKLPSKHAIKTTEKAEFFAIYVTADPSWIVCCDLSRDSMQLQSVEDFSSNCIYRLSILAQREECSLEALKELKSDQDVRDQAGRCCCQQPVGESSQRPTIITRAGFNLVKHWRDKISYQLLAKHPPVYDRKERMARIFLVLDDILRDYLSELLAERYRKRPFPLWAKIATMAWVFQALPPDWVCCNDLPLQARAYRCVMMVGTAILTTIEVLIQYKLFKASSTIRNLSLVLALLIRCTSTEFNEESHGWVGQNHDGPFNDQLCLYNENGWASVVIDLVQQHGVGIDGVDEIDEIVRSRKESEAVLKARRDIARIAQHTTISGGVLIPPSEENLAHEAWREGRPPFSRARWKPEDDFDGDRIKYWKRWHFQKEYETYYCSPHGQMRRPCERYGG